MGLHTSEHVLNQTSSVLVINEDRMADLVRYEGGGECSTQTQRP